MELMTRARQNDGLETTPQPDRLGETSATAAPTSAHSLEPTHEVEPEFSSEWAADDAAGSAWTFPFLRGSGQSRG